VTSGRRGGVLALLLLLPVTATGCASTAPAAPGMASHQRFLSLYQGSSADYEPARTVAELAEWSSVVVVARLREIREGHIRGASREDPARTEHLLHVFDVVETVRGTLPGGQVFVETHKPGREPAASFDAAAPKEVEAVLYLVPAPTQTDRPVVAAPKPAPPGEPLMSFTTPQGFLIQIDGRVAHPLEWAAPAKPLFPAGDPAGASLRAWLP
jgi:hypothetical protein